VPSHVAEPGPRARALRRTARRQRLRRCISPFNLLFVVTIESLTAGPRDHAGVGYYALCLTLFAVLIIPVAGLEAYGERLSSRLTSPRPRWQYFLFSAGYLILAGAGVLTGIRTEGHPTGWWAGMVGADLVITGVAFGLVMLGRGACWGRLRLLFWRNLPQWLQADEENWPVRQPRPARGGSAEASATWIDKKRFSTTRFTRPGYEEENVDRFLDAVQATFLGLRSTPVTADEVHGAEFPTTRLRPGYDVREVDAFLDEVALRLGASPVPSQ
jgi:DivIVA domain-containing protein